LYLWGGKKKKKEKGLGRVRESLWCIRKKGAHKNRRKKEGGEKRKKKGFVPYQVCHEKLSNTQERDNKNRQTGSVAKPFPKRKTRRKKKKKVRKVK